MSLSSSTPNEIDGILAQFFQEWEKRGETAFDEYRRRYPELAEQFRDLLRVSDQVAEARPDSDSPLPAKLGDFCIVRLMDRGGMGEVYEAQHARLGRRVAVKVIRRGRASTGARERFLREQQVLAHLHQTHIVPIFTAGEEGELEYFVMPYIEGVALSKVAALLRQRWVELSSGRTPSLPSLAGQAAKESSDSDTAAPPSGGRMRLSRAYFRSVAEIMIRAAEALEHAHQAGVLHRDLKPANVMIDGGGQCWVIDFGLAMFLRRHEQPGQETGTGAGASGVLGTPAYMAPEQFLCDRELDARTDVWGLGATLYELITLQPPFPQGADGRYRQVTGEGPAPSRVGNVPADLGAICRRAMQRNPEQRYPTAREFADDLGCWLRGEPTWARPAWPLRRLLLWARRKKELAAALLIVVSCLMVAVFFYLQSEREQGAAARLALQNEQQQAAAVRDRARLLERQALGLRLEQLRRSPQGGHWSKESWDLIHQEASQGGDAWLRDRAVAALRGLDLRLVDSWQCAGMSAAAFDSTGGRLLLSRRGLATPGQRGGGPEQFALLVADGAGPVAFCRETPVQATMDADKGAVVLRAVDHSGVLGRFVLPGDMRAAAASGEVALALTPDAAVLAAGVGQEGVGVLAVWGTGSGSLQLHKRGPAGAIALAPDGALIAGGDNAGTIAVWSMTSPGEPTKLRSRGNAIRCLKFGRDPRPGAGWRLAAAEAGGLITLWDLGRHQPQPTAFCAGSHYDVTTLAFSPDGTLLASAGRYEMRLWDAATGRLLLQAGAPDYAVDLAFAADGRRLVAVGTAESTQGDGAVWEVERGRGLCTLYGLTGQVGQLTFSPDRRLVAALAHDWQVGLWEAATGRLLNVFQAPVGTYADNAALTFDAQGALLAISTGQEARLWNTANGQQERSWQLHPGLGDRLAFRIGPDGRHQLLSFRLERADGRGPLDSDFPWKRYPRVLRLRDLLAPEQERCPRGDITVFPWGVLSAAAAPDGRAFVACGRKAEEESPLVIKAFDSATGRELWSREAPNSAGYNHLTYETNGRAVLTGRGWQEPMRLDPATGDLLGPIASVAWHQGADFWVGSSPELPGCCLLSRGRDTHLMHLNLEAGQSSIDVIFDAEGRRVAWGNRDGTVTICDIAEVQRRLAEVGLGW
jgi:serine/threonine protein kinase/WD40 repeat protein